MFIIDLDDTLFNTQLFKKNRIQALAEIGVPEDVYKQSYQEAYNNTNGINIYNDASHSAVLAQYGFDEQKINASFAAVRRSIKDYIFPDTIALLTFLKQLKQKLILLSLGEASFQKMKIAGTGIEIFCDEIFTVNDTKENIIRAVLKNHADETGIWFINDKIEETQRLISQFPQLKPILKMSEAFPEEAYKLAEIPYFKTLTEIKHYVSELLK